MWFDRFHKFIRKSPLPRRRTSRSAACFLFCAASLLLPSCYRQSSVPDSASTDSALPVSSANLAPRFRPRQTAGEKRDGQSSGCVEDTHTGLIWELKTRNGGLHNQQHKFSWRIVDDRINGGFAGYRNEGNCAGIPCDTQSYIDAVNRSRLCGLSRWRLPDRTELGGLVDYQIRYPGPTIDQSVFPNTVAQFYWSASPDANDPDSAWGVGFAFGYDYAYFKSDAAPVRLVHDSRPPNPKTAASDLPNGKQQCPPSIPATSPNSRFTLQHNGTVTDRVTGLIWMRCLLGQTWQKEGCQGKSVSIDLHTAVDRAKTASFANQRDWRLPDIRELESITELGCETPAINLRVFPGSKPASVWSSTPFANDPNRQWLLQFTYGENHVDKTSVLAQVRLVRRVGP